MTAQLALTVDAPQLEPTPVKREDVARSIKSTGIDGLRHHARSNLCAMTRAMCADEMRARGVEVVEYRYRDDMLPRPRHGGEWCGPVSDAWTLRNLWDHAARGGFVEVEHA